MSITVYYIICAVLSILVLLGISMMSKVKTATSGNFLSAASLFAGIVITLLYNQILSATAIYAYIIVGAAIGGTLAVRIKMIQMPQLVALLNGIGGFASALVGTLTLLGIGVVENDYIIFSETTAVLAIVVGMVTLVGSLVAAGKLHGIISQKPVIWKNHSVVLNTIIILLLATVLFAAFMRSEWAFSYETNIAIVLAISIGVSALFGYAFSIRVGGADMPITISLLNSLSGVAGAIAGMAIGDILLVSVGGIVGASGLFLTQIMCKSMNRSLMDILTGKTSMPAQTGKQPAAKAAVSAKPATQSPGDALLNAKSVIIVPGYGMALAQAQHLVRQLADRLEANGADVRYAIHPVAGRMPGHMSVLLAEADVPYDKLYEMHVINEDFENTDLVVVVGANDVLNPAAREAVGTPIYGMPVLNVDKAKEVIICNYDLKPGYSGVDNPLYNREGVHLVTGDAKESLTGLLADMSKGKSKAAGKGKTKVGHTLNNAKSAIIVPGYGMALAQAQHLVRQLADKLEANGTEVRYAIHPVAGRMPGHMSVLLAEADVPYSQLYEMHTINDDFENTDVVIVIGANDVLNPAAREAVGTPIYGMPVLNVDKAKEVVICNFDLKPGYSGVDNPLYTREGVHMFLGDAKESLSGLFTAMNEDKGGAAQGDDEISVAGVSLNQAKSAIIVPGYGMALAQAQHLVRQLADRLEANGTQVRYAIHPVAGRMPGHMSVLLAEAEVPYDQLYEMHTINDDFANTDIVVVVGANDVLNPAAREAVGTPIYGMPVLNVDKAKEVIICNYDLKPGYSGVDNPLYESDNVHMLTGDAKETLTQLLGAMSHSVGSTPAEGDESAQVGKVLGNAKSVIIVPGYGMALAQAQHLVRQLADRLEANGTEVRYAIHPVAGRMPGHMSVLLAEADVPYDQLYEMHVINDDFENTDAVVVIGANDVLNPAAREAVGTPIYGMPVLNVDKAKEVVICNFDLKPGYSGVDNPLYERERVYLMTGDAKDSLTQIMASL